MVGKTDTEVKHRFSGIHMANDERFGRTEAQWRGSRHARGGKSAPRRLHTSLKSRFLNFQGDFFVRRESHSSKIIPANNNARIATSYG